MGYTRIVQFGDTTEFFYYEKNRPNYKRPHLSAIAQKRLKAIRELRKKKKDYKRRIDSILRSVNNFRAVVHHNNHYAQTVVFITLTFAFDVTYKQACQYTATFYKRVKKAYPEVPLSYISVPELTKKGRFHFHLLVYNLPTYVTEKEFSPFLWSKEDFEFRTTRNLQRLFERGYLDLRVAHNRSGAIANYMGKYMAKSLFDERYEVGRGYACSRNIKKITSYGSNTLSTFTDLIATDTVKEEKYTVPFLGECIKKTYKKINNEE